MGLTPRMRARTLVLMGAAALASVVAFRWSMAERRPASPPAGDTSEPADTPAPAAPAPPPPPPAAPAPVAPTDPRRAAATPPAAAEAQLMASMRAELATNPTRALALAREAERRFGETASAAERGRIAIEARVRLNQIAEARDEAEPFIRKYRGTDHARAVENLTGVHPRPSGPVEGRAGSRSGGSSP
jgi:hypothetical protein